MMKEKYYVSVMRPVYQRAVLEVRGKTQEEAKEQALRKARRFTEHDWARIATSAEDSAIAEDALASKDFTDRAEAVECFVGKLGYSYALLQANLDAGEGRVIAPNWFADCSDLLVADLTKDWLQQLEGIYQVGVTGFVRWLKRMKAPAVVIDFLAARDRLRRKRHQNLDEEV